MGTDIYGVIEVRALAGAEPEARWVHCMDLYPLYPGGDYSSLGCLFGIRNRNGWEPVAEGRGLPADVSDAVRESYEHDARIDAAIHGGTWVCWPELRDLDMTVTPRVGGIACAYERVTREEVLGPGTGWEHVFAVMRTLAQRFGDEGVRLVAWFD